MKMNMGDIIVNTLENLRLPFVAHFYYVFTGNKVGKTLIYIYCYRFNSLIMNRKFNWKNLTVHPPLINSPGKMSKTLNRE